MRAEEDHAAWRGLAAQLTSPKKQETCASNGPGTSSTILLPTLDFGQSQPPSSPAPATKPAASSASNSNSNTDSAGSRCGCSGSGEDERKDITSGGGNRAGKRSTQEQQQHDGEHGPERKRLKSGGSETVERSREPMAELMSYENAAR